MRLRSVLLTAVATAPLFAFGALAQDEPAPERRGAVGSLLDEIVISATKKREVEDVQRVPIAVSAFGADQLDALNFKDLYTVGALIPNVTLREIGTFKGVAAFNIRGLGTLNSIPSIDPSVGAFVDGVYYGINAGVMFDNFDLESVEVLRGPQGILFGRNVIGGAVLVNTTRPTEEFTATFSSSVNSGFRGTGVDYTFSGIVSGPLSDKLRGKVAVYYNKDEGWFKNQFDNTKFGENETKLFRLAVAWDPTDNLEFLLRFERGEQDGEGVAAQSHRNAAGVLGLDFDRDTHDISVNNRGEQFSEWNQAILETNLQVGFGDGVITNIFGWRSYENGVCLDIDATPATRFDSSCLQVGAADPVIPGPGNDQDQISNELRYAGAFGPVDLTTGAFYFGQDIVYSENRSLFGGAVRQSGGGIQEHHVFGAFVNTDWHATEKLTLNGGIRFTKEWKDARITSLEAPKPGAAITGFCFVRDGTCPFDFEDSDSWSNIDYRFGFQYQALEELMAYFHWSTGFRSGGYNLRNSAPTDSPGPSDEEKIKNYEVGIKSEVFEGVQVNLAGFFTKAEDLQRAVISVGATGPVQRIANTADAEIFGFEMDAQISILENLAVIGSIGYLDAEYTKVLFDLTGDGIVDGADLGLPLPNAPELTSSISVVYDLELPNAGLLSSRVTYSHRDATNGTNTDTVIPSQDTLDFNVSWIPLPTDRLQVSLFGRNVTNDVLFTSDTQLPASIGSTYATLSKGRQIGLELTVKY